MAESHVVTGLVAKRAEITGQIEAYQAELSRLQSSVTHLDYTIKLFAPEYDLRTCRMSPLMSFAPLILKAFDIFFGNAKSDLVIDNVISGKNCHR